MNKITRNNIIGFVLRLVEFMPSRTAMALILPLALSFTEGLGVAALIPLLGVVGFHTGAGSAEKLGEYVGSFFNALGVTPTLGALLILYVLLIALRAGLSRLHEMLNISIYNDFTHNLRKRLYADILKADWLYFTRHSSSELVHALTSEVERAGSAATVLLGLVLSTVMFTVYFSLALYVSPALTSVVLITGVILVWLQRNKTGISIKTGESLSRDKRRLFSTIAELIGGIKTAKSHGAEMSHSQTYKDASEGVRDAQIQFGKSFSGFKMWFDIASVAILALIVYSGIEYLALSPVEVLFLLFLYSRLMPRVSSIQQNIMTFVHLLPSYEQIQTTENLAREAAENLSASDHEIKFIEKITLSDISFSYGDKQVLRGVNITLNAGTTTALIGPSGAGKTTVADLISGLLKPSQGVIAIDGAALDEANTRSWRNRLSYVAQDTFIFDDTVMNNLLWARPDAGDSEIERSLISANALEFVSELENGLNTYVGERGVKLSSGQRQRIALARALLRRPSLLILDEATSALDTENEAHILSALEGLRGSATVLIISHRISAVKNADFIYVIDGGEVVESGSLEELKADKNSRFNKVMSSKGVFD